MPRHSPAVRRNSWPAVIAFVLLAVVGVARYFLGGDEPIAPPPAAVAEGTFQVKHVIDGDTFRLEDGRRVRLIGVDCPEMFVRSAPDAEPDRTRTEPWAREATAFTQEFIGDGQVELRFDRERLDQYDRLLAYVYRDDRLLNEELLRAGLAEARLRFHYGDHYKRRFEKAEKAAQEERLGIWSERRD